MTQITSIHIEEDEKLDCSITETINDFLAIGIGTQLNIHLSQKHAKELCEKLEAALYSEPTYDDLVKENENLRYKLENTQEKLYEKEYTDFTA